MKFLFDLFPVFLFFLTYKLASKGEHTGDCLSNMTNSSLMHQPILLATIVGIAATFVQIGWLLSQKKRVDTMLWLSLAVIVVFGGATLYFRNPTFIQWKPTILYWIYAISLLFGLVVLKKNLIKELMQEQITLPDVAWSKLNMAWMLFMAVMGAANLIAAKTLSCDGWIDFKLYGLTGIMLLFAIGQSLLLAKYFDEDSAHQNKGE